MSKFSDRFASAKQDWETPQELFDSVNDEFHFTLDAAASLSNTKVKDCFLTEADDALQTGWGNNIVWLNPPYGARTKAVSDWVKKAWTESQNGATVVMLIPARTNTNWFHDFCLAKGEVRFIRGRPKFGDAEHGLPQPLCLVIFRGVTQ